MGQLNKVQNLDVIINSFFKEKFDNHQAEIYFKIVHLNQNNFRVQHSILTEYVYSNYNDVKLEDENNIDKEIFWQENVLALDKYLSNLVSDLDGLGTDFTENEKKVIKEYKKEIEELPNRIAESIKLALSQYKAFFKEFNDATEELTVATDGLNKVEKNYKEILDKYKKVSKKYDEVSNKLDSSSSDFISMLGIFSALIFAVFGGFEAFKSIFTNINKASISMIIINSSILMIGLIVLVFLLIQSICILSGKTFLACGCKNTSICSHKFYERYPLFSFSIGFFLSLLILGLLCKVDIKLPWNLKFVPLLSYLGLILLILIVAILIICAVIKSVTLVKESKRNINN